ncbi:hypothetical protein [Saccharothrix luteola]|uniref:hypothetical protein n=1 Tax=Saccharothrix luteola TaxID=2893018 RepID=UPI001E5DDDDF|nr:hypothetical protein [Saccharothrix luteola]MCC8249320.1 hypothetical protein [Saccharothrix luteola]
MSGVQARHRAAVLVAAALVALAPGVGATAEAKRASCGERDFCLYAGSHQTGKILFQRTVTVDEEEGTVHLVNEDEIDPLIRPRSARLPGLPEGLSCIAVLSEVPHYQGDYQEAAYGYPLDEDAVTELSGQTVGSIDSDCG